MGVGGAGFLQGGFPALPLFLSGFLVCKAFALRGFAAEADLLHDLGELFLQRPVGEVGPFAGAVRAAAVEYEAQAAGWGVVEAGDAHP
ncbi:hypothetical protein EYS09_10020 [Streptomyces kasugaensis]|uniref:HD domain-containing protein n=1 Tax=Streptomyces kasugaensis TaxID=1946 RepID=A0A4Q9HX67_STRKA|nr:hypothetical protein EYS09_10020 [Streptomyces kasugaensis]